MPQSIRQAVGYSAVARSAAIGIQFAGSVVLTRGLGPESFGLYSLLINGIGITSSILNLGISQAISKQVAESEASNDPAQIYSILNTAAIIHIGVSIIWGISVYGISDWVLYTWLDGQKTLFALYLISFPVLLLANDLSSGLFGLREIRTEATRRLLHSLTLLSLNSMLILGFGFGIYSAAAVYTLSQFAILIWLGITFIQFFQEGRLNFTKTLSVNQLLTFALPLSLVRPIDLLIKFAPAYVSKAMGETAAIGNQQAAYISLALLLGSILQSVLSSALFSTQGYLARWATQNNWLQIQRYTLFGSLIIIIAFVCLAFISVIGFPTVVNIVYGSAYEGVTTYFLLSLIIAGEKTLIVLYNTVLYAFGYTGKTLQSSLLELILYVSCIVLFIAIDISSDWGYLLLLAAVFASGIRSIFLMWVSYRAIKSKNYSNIQP